MASPRTTSFAGIRLGDLEVAVLEHLWEAGEGSAKSVHAVIGTARGITHNTLQSTLERLFRKGLLTRAKSGHAFHYAPAVSRDALITGLIGGVLNQFQSDGPLSAVAFAEFADALDDESLRELEALLRARREAGR